MGFFKTGGFDLASVVLGHGIAQDHKARVTLMQFLNEASAAYPELLRRQAFSHVALDLFSDASDAERDYLGRLAQGYCGFHYLGVYGDVALERVRRAKETVWLLDSDMQIPALALAAPTQHAFLACCQRLSQTGVRVFTTDNLFDETWRHFRFATRVVSKHGEGSPEVLAAAVGNAPYSRSNQFLEGFIRWQKAGNPADWSGYLSQVLNGAPPIPEHLKERLGALGVEVMPFDGWPGFTQEDYNVRDTNTASIVRLRQEPDGEESPAPSEEEVEEYGSDFLWRKAKPEAEALIIVERERTGAYHMLSTPGKPSHAWFVSHTGVLNRLVQGRCTWRPESFLAFVNTALAGTESENEGRGSRMFEALLWSIELEGVSVLDRASVEAAYGSLAQKAVIELEQERDAYDSALGAKYGRSPVDVVKSLPVAEQPLAAIQLAHERAQQEQRRAEGATARAAESEKKLRNIERETGPLEKYRKKVAARQQKAKQKAAKSRSKKSK